jgi:hypothetical protein
MKKSSTRFLMMASRTPEPSQNINSEDHDQFPPLPEPAPSADSESIADEVRIGKGAQPWYIKYLPYVLIVWALWFAFWGGEGLFHVEQPVNLFFSGVVIAWAVYHLLAPRLHLPNLPLG